MNDNVFEDDTHPSRPTTHARYRTRLKPRTLAASCAAAATLAALAWQMASAFPPSGRFGQSLIASTVGLASGASANAAPAASSSSAAPGTAAPTAPEVPAVVLQQLAEFKATCERVVQQSQAVDQRLDRTEADLADLKQQFEKSQAALATAHQHARVLARQLRVAHAAAAEARAAQLQQPKVLSVDTWNGRPSVSVQVGTEVRFFSEGDVVANTLVRKADPSTQRVEFVSAASVPVPTHAATGEGR